MNYKKFNEVFYIIISLMSCIGILLFIKNNGDYGYGLLIWYFVQLIYDLLIVTLLFKKIVFVKYLIITHLICSSIVWGGGQVLFFLMPVSSFYPIYQQILAGLNSLKVNLLIEYYCVVLLWIVFCWINSYLIHKKLFNEISE